MVVLPGRTTITPLIPLEREGPEEKGRNQEQGSRRILHAQKEE